MLEERLEIEVNGLTFVVLPFLSSMLAAGETVCRVAMVADTVEEVRSLETMQEAVRQLMQSVQRRGLVPRGHWAVGFLPVDWPLWRDHLDASIAEVVEAKLKEINGHVMIYALMDSAGAEDVIEF